MDHSSTTTSSHSLTGSPVRMGILSSSPVQMLPVTPVRSVPKCRWEEQPIICDHSQTASPLAATRDASTQTAPLLVGLETSQAPLLAVAVADIFFAQVHHRLRMEYPEFHQCLFAVCRAWRRSLNMLRPGQPEPQRSAGFPRPLRHTPTTTSAGWWGGVSSRTLTPELHTSPLILTPGEGRRKSKTSPL